MSNLLENRFSVPQIAHMLSVSVSTVQRRLGEFGLSVRALYANLSDAELDEIVKSINQHHPTCGNAQMQGHLISKGYRIQQICIQESMRRIDPCGTSL